MDGDTLPLALGDDTAAAAAATTTTLEGDASFFQFQLKLQRHSLDARRAWL